MLKLTHSQFRAAAWVISFGVNPESVKDQPYLSGDSIYVLVSADKAANNIVVVCRLHYIYINTLKQELNGTKAYEETSTDEKSHSNDLPYKFAVNVKERQDKLPTMYWLPKLHKRPYKPRLIANSSSCTATELSNYKLLASLLSNLV